MKNEMAKYFPTVNLPQVKSAKGTKTGDD